MVNDNLLFEVVKPQKTLYFTYYQCSNTFKTAFLDDLYRKKPVGLLILDNNSATFGLINDHNYSILKTIYSGVSGKHNQGGQSQRRFERLRENSLNEYYKRVGKYAKDLLPFNIFIGGQSITKDKFINNDYLDYRFNIIDSIDLAYDQDEGMRELIGKIYENDLLGAFLCIQEKKILQNALKLVPDHCLYTWEDVKNSLNRVKIVIFTEKMRENVEKMMKNVNIDFYLVNSDIEEVNILNNIGGIIGIYK